MNSQFLEHKYYDEENVLSHISNDDIFTQNFEVFALYNDDNYFHLQSLSIYTKELDHNSTSFDLKHVDYFKEYPLYILNHDFEQCCGTNSITLLERKKNPSYETIVRNLTLEDFDHLNFQMGNHDLMEEWMNEFFQRTSISCHFYVYSHL